MLVVKKVSVRENPRVYEIFRGENRHLG